MSPVCVGFLTPIQFRESILGQNFHENAHHMQAYLKKKINSVISVCKSIFVSTALGKLYFEQRKNRLWTKFKAQNPSLVNYGKAYLTPSNLVHKLKSEGLIIPDRVLAEHVIFRENYFRFKAYCIPFLDNATGKFHPATTFDDLYGLYCADQKLRDFLLPLLARLEVRIRATVDNVVTSTTNDPFWHLNTKYFNVFADVERALTKAQQRFNQGKQEFVVHYRNRYFTNRSYDYRHTPPFWIISEIFTLEQLLSVCKSLNEKCPEFIMSVGQSKLERVAKPFGVDSYSSLITNLKCILELRNLCAHHSRLWNRNLQNPAGLKSKHSIKVSHPNRLYSHLLMIRLACKNQGITDNIKPFMVSMFASTPVFARDMANMGFPVDWQDDDIWK